MTKKKKREDLYWSNNVGYKTLLVLRVLRKHGRYGLTANQVLDGLIEHDYYPSISQAQEMLRRGSTIDMVSIDKEHYCECCGMNTNLYRLTEKGMEYEHDHKNRTE